MVRMMRTFLLGGLLGPGLLVLAGCSGASTADEAANAEPDGPSAEASKTEEAVPVEVRALERGPIEAVLRFSTNLEAENAVAVYSQAARQITLLAAEEGQLVGKGQVLVRLQDDEQRTALAKVRSQLTKAEREYERQQRLFGEQLISEQAMNDATYELEQLKLAEEEALRQLSYTEVRAPISGTITARKVSLGDQVMVNQHLFDIVDFGSIVARVYVPEKELPRLADGQLARVTSPASGQTHYEGRIERLAPIVDPKSGTVKVTVALPRTTGLMPGMFVDVELVTATEAAALLVPKRALVYDNDQVFVYRLGADLRVSRVRVEPRLENKDSVEPKGGLAPGDRVVVAGQAGLKEGALVRLVASEG